MVLRVMKPLNEGWWDKDSSEGWRNTARWWRLLQGDDRTDGRSGWLSGGPPINAIGAR